MCVRVYLSEVVQFVQQRLNAKVVYLHYRAFVVGVAILNLDEGDNLYSQVGVVDRRLWADCKST